MKIKLKKKNSPKKNKIEYDPLLYGHDMTENIVAVEPLKDESMVEIFFRENGKLHSEYTKSKAFFYTNSEEPTLDKLWDDDTVIWELEESKNCNHLNRLVETNNIRSAWWYKKQADSHNFYMIRESGQYLLSSGRTLFKGMEFDDIVRMYFDIETYTTPGYKFTNPNRPGDTILNIAIKTNRKGNEKICIALDEDGWATAERKEKLNRISPGVQWIFVDSERDLLEAFFVVIEHVNPDAFINHNIFNFDLWFIHERCRLLDIPMEMGRDRTRPNVYDSSVYMGEKSRDIKCFEFYGRHVIDTEILARQDDIVKRRYENYQLKSLVREIGEESDDRILIPGHRIADAWDNKDPQFDRADLLAYSVDDAVDAQKLDHAFGHAAFESTKFTPYPYQDVFRLATGGKSEALFVRHYYDEAHSLPKKDKKQKYPGGYAGVAKFGYIDEDTTLADVASLYPSIGISKNIQPYKDVLGYYQKVLRTFRDMRYKIKYSINETDDEELRTQLKSTDGAIKIYLNTISYGYIGSPFSLFNDYSEATRITEEGQKVLKKMIREAEKDGATTIKYDTDGAVFIPPTGYRGSEEKEREFINKLSDIMPEDIDIGLDGRYKATLTVDGKSYALLDHNDKVTIKGDTLKSRRKEHFILQHLEYCVREILHGNLNVLKDSFHYWKDKIENRELTREDVRQYAEIKEPLETYRTKVELGSGNGGRNPAAAYELACEMEEKGIDITVGDRIEYFVGASPKTLKIDGRTGKPRVKDKYDRVCDLAKNIDDFNPDLINVDHYLGRLRSSSEPLYMLFYKQETLREKFDIRLYKDKREKMEEIGDNIFNNFIK